MAGYYVYLYSWCHIFGDTEFALRAANTPFFLLVGVTLAWLGSRIAPASWFWIVPACLPFTWYYAGEARPYFIVMTFSLVALACLIDQLTQSSAGRDGWQPYVILTSIWVGAACHMLMLLAVLPLAGVAASHVFATRSSRLWIRAWRRPLIIFSVPYLLLSGYLAFTFWRGTAYDYPRPGLLSIGSTAVPFWDCPRSVQTENTPSTFAHIFFSLFSAVWL